MGAVPRPLGSCSGEVLEGFHRTACGGHDGSDEGDPYTHSGDGIDGGGSEGGSDVTVEQDHEYQGGDADCDTDEAQVPSL